MSRVLPVALIVLVACEDGKFSLDDTGATGDAWEPGTMAVVATVAGDYTTGGLATVSLADGVVTDDLLTLSGDPALAMTDDHVVVLNRGTVDSVLLLEPGSLSAPSLEFGLEDGANPHDAHMCGDALWVSQYGAAALHAYDPSNGNLLASVDLAAYDDGDGLPEASSMVVTGDTLYLALEQLDQTTAYWSANGGMVVAIDCDRRIVLDEWEVSPVPRVFADPDDADGLLVRTGAYFDAEGAFAWDGGLFALDPATASLEAIAPAESEVELNYTGIAPITGGKAIVVATDASWLYSVYCLDRASGALSLIETLDSFVSAVEVNAQGEAWLATRASWAAPEAAAGVRVYDVSTCALAGEPITFSLEPYAIAFN